MSSANLMFLVISVLISAIKCTKTPDNYGEGICQYPDCNPQLPPPSVSQPYGTPPPPPKPTTPPPSPPAQTEYPAPPPPKQNPCPPPPVATGYPPYGAPPPPVATGYPPYGAPPPPVACQGYCPPPPGVEGQCCVQPYSPPSPPPNPYTYLNESSAATNICSAVIFLLFPFLSFLHV